MADFLERFAGVRWYWRAEYGGRSIPRRASAGVLRDHNELQRTYDRLAA